MSANKNLTLTDLGYRERTFVMEALQKGATRRDVMRWLGAAGIGTMAAGGIITAATGAIAATPKRGGRIVAAGDQHGPNDTLDPALFTSGIDYARGRTFYGSLTRLTKNLTAEPELAESFEANASATEWTFKIRKGVEFHDGKTLTADDVLYTMNRHIGKDSTSKAASLVADVKEWKKVNDYEVKAILETPNADLPVALGTFHFKIIKDGQKDFTTTVGTGPFRVKEFKPGVRSIATRFENYWGSEGPYVDEIEMFGIADPTTRINAFMSGQVDLVANVPPKAIEQIERTDGLDIWALPSSAYVNIATRLDMSPGNDRHLVLALKHLQDRERLVKGVMKGQGSIGNDQPIGPAYADYCPDVAARPLDHDKAKWHMQKSGIGNSEIEIVAAQTANGAVEQALFLQREAAKIGLNVNVKKVSTDGYWGAVWMKAPICVSSWNMRPTANVMMTLAYKSDAPWNESFWKNDRFDELLVKSRAELDPAKRKEQYCEMQRLIADEAGTLLPAFRNYVDGKSSRVKGEPYVPLNVMGGAEFPEFVWLDS